MTFKQRFKTKAFTLIEVSIVILIIGIMLAGTFIGTRIIAKSRLAAAESLARSSPVPGIKDNMLWLETSLSASIDSSQTNDGSLVTAWYDQSSNSGKPLVVAVGTGPTYANTINYVHAIKFVGSTANYLQISDASFLNGTDYTIMVLEKRQSGGSNNYFLGETSSNPNDSLALGYGSDSTVVHTQGNQSYTTGAAVSSYASSTDKPRQFTFVHSSTAGNSTYINGILAAQDATKTAHLSGITTLAIGKGYTGEIGEIAIYVRALKPEERQPIEDYAGKKWTRSINRASAPSGSCVGYTITESGCDLASATCNISQAGISSTVVATSSSTSISCNQTNYSGSVSYTCAAGVANVTGSCGCTAGYTGSSCSTCDTGYVSGGGGTCVLGAACSTTSVTGVSTPTSVAHLASGSLTCNAAGYSGSVTYNCNNGTLNPTGSCAVSVVCTGGVIDTTTVPGSTIHKFSTVGSATLTCPSAKTVQVLVVGGGGGSSDVGGGGGGGQVVSSTLSVTSSATITVGSAGGRGYNRTGNATCSGNTGGTSSITNGSTTLQALGGSGARGRSGGANNALAGTGYTGGGAAYPDDTGTGSAGTGGATYKGGDSSSSYGGGGGGGAGGAGQSRPTGANGGVGVASTITGPSVYYGGGGGGSGYSAGAGGAGGNGGGGAGTANSTDGFAGTNGLGGGGGAGSNGSATGGGGNGGSGVVIVRY